ncbi:MAG: adenylate/guanylate cyclase domain-containing protein [Verrucomicrobiales bacterium]|nr:adenylate/guanylate cyclase domain-containing protein [Verrucomicrobiales bacterium]
MILAAVFQQDRSRRVLIQMDENPLKIGRSPQPAGDEDIVMLRIPWNDRLISRNHFVATLKGKELLVERLPALPGHTPPNEFYSNRPFGQRSTLSDPLQLKLGDSFCIGKNGHTSFYWLQKKEDLDQAILAYDQELTEKSSSYEAEHSDSNHHDEVEALDEYSLRLQLKLLQRELPEQVLSGWTGTTELFTRTATFLQNALPGQKGVTAVFLALEPGNYELLNPDPNIPANFKPSTTLLSELNIADPSPGDIHVWTSEEEEAAFATRSLGSQVDWVAALPVSVLDEGSAVLRDKKKRPIYLYIETRQASSTAARSFIPFLRLITSLIASLLSARAKQRVQDQMSAYFSPALRRLLQDGNEEQLEPAMTECTVLFCDRRGSSRIMEKARTDEEILIQLEDNQTVVGEIIQNVFDHDGVITDFAGDGVLALWGWPAQVTASEQHALHAVNTAVAIAKHFAPRVHYNKKKRQYVSPIRVGVSTGRIAVGKTGPAQQMHISVFGRQVNFGARLESIAKEFGIPVLVSSETIWQMPETTHRFRKLCYMKPAGFLQSYPIFELVLPKELGGSGADETHIKKYEQALQLFVERKWSECRQLLETLPQGDQPARWLHEKTEKYSNKALDENWDGSISSFAK